MGHGTAVPGHFDIDLVIYSRGKNAFISPVIGTYLSVLYSLLPSLTHTHSLSHALSLCLCMCMSLSLHVSVCLSLSLSLSLFLSLSLSFSVSLSSPPFFNAFA